jgi:hypothetical protein
MSRISVDAGDGEGHAGSAFLIVGRGELTMAGS